MKQFGLVGKSLSHSFSASHFKDKFEKEGIHDAHYALYELNSIDEFKSLIEDHAFSGLNVTIPFKESIIPFLDELSDSAKEIGAVNTVQFVDGRTIGHNTDIIGFKQSIKPFFKSHHERALILGTGGAAKAIEHVLDELGVESLFVSRNPIKSNEISYPQLNDYIISSHNLIVNCTPVGTYPEIENCPNIPFDEIGESHLLIDLIYNPIETKFLAIGKAHGASIMNGLNMLKIQAEAAWKIWNH